MLSPKINVKLPPRYGHWGFKPVLRYSKPHTYPTFIGEEKSNKMHLLLYRDHLAYKQNERKACFFKKKGGK